MSIVFRRRCYALLVVVGPRVALVTDESAAASPENFDQAIGRKIARDNARQKIWALEGYLLRERLLGV